MLVASSTEPNWLKSDPEQNLQFRGHQKYDQIKKERAESVATLKPFLPKGISKQKMHSCSVTLQWSNAKVT